MTPFLAYLISTWILSVQSTSFVKRGKKLACCFKIGQNILIFLCFLFFFPSPLYYCRGFSKSINWFCYFSDSLGMDAGCLQLLLIVGKLAIIPHAELICLCFKNSGKIPKPAKLFIDTMRLSFERSWRFSYWNNVRFDWSIYTESDTGK